jgi:small membrane protein
MEVIQIIIIVFALFALSRAFLRFKDNRLTVRDFSFWVVLWIAVIILSFMPNLISYASVIFGIGRGIDMIVYLGIIVLFYLVFRLYVKIENQEKELTRLVRNISIGKAGKDREKKRK